MGPFAPGQISSRVNSSPQQKKLGRFPQLHPQMIGTIVVEAATGRAAAR